MKPRPSLLAIALISILIGAGVTAGIVFAHDDHDGGQEAATSAVLDGNGIAPTGASLTATRASANGMDFTAVYDNVRPSIVEITTGGSSSQSRQAGGLGSGIVVDTSGDILTNNHVVSGFSAATVTFADGTTGQAQVVATDPGNDVAVIKVQADGSELHPATLGDSSQAKVGNVVFAVGNPFGLDGTLTTGVISGLDRTLPSNQSKPLTGLLQTDAAINPGNSGGALFNVQGEVIGINTALENPGGDTFAGIGYVVPINTAKGELTQLLAGTTPSHARLGIAGKTLSPNQAQQLGVAYGVAVASVAPGSAAEQAGLQGSSNGTGDVITAIDGTPTETFTALTNVINSKNVGDEVTLTIHRNGKDMQIKVTLQAWDSTASGQ